VLSIFSKDFLIAAVIRIAREWKLKLQSRKTVCLDGETSHLARERVQPCDWR
jgi:hypothetical protein